MSAIMPIIASVAGVVTLVTGFISVKDVDRAESRTTGPMPMLPAAQDLHAADFPTEPQPAQPIEPHPHLALPDHPSKPFETIYTTRHAATVARNSGPMPKHASPVENGPTVVATEHTATPTPTRSYETNTGSQPVYMPRHSATTPATGQPAVKRTAEPASTPAPAPVAVSSRGSRAVAFALAQLGKPYIYGGTGPAGFDCSGLAEAAWAAAGVTIPRTSYAQWSGLTRVSTSALEPGDILVFYGASHVGIYIGGGEMIHAPHTGTVVEKASLAGYWDSVLLGAVRP